MVVADSQSTRNIYKCYACQNKKIAKTSSVHMTTRFSALTKWDHDIHTYICAKFHVDQFTQSLSILCSVLTSCHIKLVRIPLQMTIGFGELQNEITKC